ncbi:MAG: hypothetical protein Q7T57_04635 [Dehalococcoidales bacterium]|nr:hypothetical protein [Dehalococcoidales bacterium]
MSNEIPYAVLLSGGVLLSLYLSNLFYDYKCPQYITRKVAHIGAGVAFLLCPFLFHSFWWPLGLTAAFMLLLVAARFYKPDTFRGAGGSGRPNALAEINFPLAAVVSIAVGWGWLGEPWLGTVPITFVGFGDGITGLIRSKVYGKEVKGNYGSIGMLATCLLLAYFIHPYWVGAVGAGAAVLAEKYTPTTAITDDNLSIPILSVLVMAVVR